MHEQSHDGGALFEFELQQRTDREIEVKHRGTGHVYRFLISEDGSSLPARVSKLDDVAYMTALQAELRRSTRNELVSLFQEATKRRVAGETLASIAKSYAVDISMISRL